MIPNPMPLLPNPTSIQKNYKLAGSSALVNQLAALGYDETLYGRPNRALLFPVLSDTKFIAPVNGQAGMIGFGGDIIWHPRFDHCEFTVEQDPFPAKWGALVYGLIEPVFENCYFHNVIKEHGIYPHMQAGGLYNNCRFENIGAQAIQIVERAYEIWDPKGLLIPGNIRVENSAFVNCGLLSGIGRASFALSFFGPQGDAGHPILSGISKNSISIKNCGVYHRVSVGGAMLFQRRPYFEVIDSEISYIQTGGDGSKPLILSDGSKAGKFENFRADGGKIQVIDMPAGKLELKNVSGNATLMTGKTGADGKVNWTKRGSLDAIRNAII